jgi:phospholipase/lecithinase/hemolysin
MTILSLLAVLGIARVSAAAPNYDAIFIFGDSYCDVGNVVILGGKTVTGVPYYNGGSSNGPIWLEHVAGGLRLPAAPSLLGGTDYAYAGAWATATQVVKIGTIPSIPQQVAMYLSQHEGKADPEALYVIEGGINDILHVKGLSADELGLEIATALAGSEQTLRQAGARNFVIPTLFNIGLLPIAQKYAIADLAATQATNSHLSQLLEPEGLLADVHIIRLDLYSLMNSVQTDPTHFGFTNITTPCLNKTVCTDPDHTFFWDLYHPTEAGYALFAVALETALWKQGNAPGT